jgi:hypothetical protein
MQVQIDEEAESVGEKEEEKFGKSIQTMDQLNAHHSICNNAAPSWKSVISVFIFHYFFLR